MHILARGDIWQRLRLASGLVLFVFVATHLANHALGLVGIDAMLAMQDVRKAVTRTWIGSGRAAGGVRHPYRPGAGADRAAADVADAALGGVADRQRRGGAVPARAARRLQSRRGGRRRDERHLRLRTRAHLAGLCLADGGADRGRVASRLHRPAPLAVADAGLRPRAAVAVGGGGGAAGNGDRRLHGIGPGGRRRGWRRRVPTIN